MEMLRVGKYNFEQLITNGHELKTRGILRRWRSDKYKSFSRELEKNTSMI